MELKSPFLHTLDVTKKYACSDHICPCSKFHTCHVERYGQVTMSSSQVVVNVRVLREGIAHQAGFGPMTFGMRRCVHDIDLFFRVKMSMNQWDHVCSKNMDFVIFQGVLKGSEIDVRSKPSGVLAAPGNRTRTGDTDEFMTCEWFAGGFSGWSHALRRLCQLGYKFVHKIALDNDSIAAEAYIKTHRFQNMCGPDSFEWDEEELPSHLFIQGDARVGCWHHLLGETAFDVMLLSPPCPAFSMASSWQGLMKDDGRLTLEVWGMANLLKPKIMAMEMVAGMRNHEHWKLIRDVIEWSGYSIRSSSVINLLEQAPQNRERLLVIATLDGVEFFPHRIVPWPAVVRPTLETFDYILKLDEPWLSQVKLDAFTLSVYMDPAMLPRSVNQRNQRTKKTKLDVEQYRIKFIQGTFGCVMSNYGFGHLLPQVSLNTFGLYGTLFASAEELRFLAVPEIAMLMAPLMPIWIPDDQRSAVRLIGNGISCQHALIVLVNCLGLLTDMSGVEAQELFCEAMKSRLTASCIKIEKKMSGFLLSRDEDSCRPTMMMHETCLVTVRSPTDAFQFRAESGVCIADALKTLTGDSMPNIIYLLPGGKLESRVSLPNCFKADDVDVFLYAEVPSALRVHPSAFQLSENMGSCIAVLTAKGTVVLKRDHGLTVADVLMTMNHSMEIRCTFLTGLLGDKHHDERLCPNVVLGRDYLSESDNLQMFDYIRISVNESDVTFHAGHQALKQLLELFQTTALDEVMAAVGWFFAIDAEAFAYDDIKCIRLIRKPAALAVTPDEAVYCLAVQLFLIRIKNSAKMGRNPSIACSIKMWNSLIWEGSVDSNFTLDTVDRSWEMIAGWFNIRKPWRYVVNGRSINPEWPVGSFADHESGQSHVKIFMLLGLQGGAPADLRSVDETHSSENSGMMGHMADFESNSFSAALTHALQKFVDGERTMKHFDISNLLEINVGFLDGLMCFTGTFDKLKTLIDMMIKTGIEKILAFCGWMLACHFTSIVEPVEAQVILFRKPLIPAVSEDFVKALLRATLICVGIPTFQDLAEEAVLTRIKLHNVVVYHGQLPRNMPLQEIIDVWDQASTVVDHEAVVRLVSHTGVTVNPDFAIRHYTRCGPDDTTMATFSFVRAMHGGGPSDAKISNKHDLHVKQRNSLATFLIQQGADIHECIQCIDKLLLGAGVEGIASIMDMKNAGKKMEAIVKLANALNITMPNLVSKIDKAKKKVALKYHEQAKNVMHDLPIESLMLQPGYLRNEDESESTQLHKVTPNTSGVVLSRYDEAKEWLNNGSIISQDEFSLIVVGRCLHECKEECQPIQMPVLLNKEPLVVSGCLHHLGAKRASVNVDEQCDIPVADTQVLALTAYKDEFSEETWNLLLKSPVKHMVQALSKEVGEITMLSPPWGRSFHRAAKKCDPLVATSVQIHIRIAKTEMKRTIKASGRSGIYCTPKTEDRKIVKDFMIVWLNQTQVEFAVSLSKVDNHCGVIRGSKGESFSRGIRFEKADYLQAFAILRPDDKLPQIVTANFHFKIAPTPLGSTQEQVQAWLNAQEWDARPLKSLSGNCWLCASETRFETVFSQWNGCPILVKWLEDRKESSPVVLAGMFQSHSNARTQETPKMALASNANGTLVDDPWSTWITNKGGTGLSLSSRASGNVPIPNIPARKLESPIEDRFARHDGALQDLRNHTDKELEAMKESISRIEKQADMQAKQMQNNADQTCAEFKSLRAETANQLQAMSTMFAESLKTTLASQEVQLSSQFAELKEMIKTRAGGATGSSPPQKKTKVNGQENDL